MGENISCRLKPGLYVHRNFCLLAAILPVQFFLQMQGIKWRKRLWNDYSYVNSEACGDGELSPSETRPSRQTCDSKTQGRLCEFIVSALNWCLVSILAQSNLLTNILMYPQNRNHNTNCFSVHCLLTVLFCGLPATRLATAVDCL